MGDSVKKIGGAFGLGGGGASGDASKAIMRGIRKGIDYGKEQLGTTVGEFQPYTQAGSQSTGLMGALLGLQGVDAQRQAYENYQMSPGQEWLRTQGEQTLLRNAAATGGLGGGNVLKALNEYGIGFASQDFNNYYNRLAGLSGQGAGMVSNLGGLRNAYAGNMLNAYTGQGEAKASGIMGAYNNKMQGYGNLLNFGAAAATGIPMFGMGG